MIKQNLVAFILICILSLIVYTNSLNNSFHFDDEHYVVRNTYIRKIQNIPAFFQSPRYSSSEKPFTSHYRPLVVSSYALNYAIGGLNPSGYHIVNLGFHVGTAYLLFLIVHAMSGTYFIALASALIFAVHPFNSEVVNYITARSSVMCAFFYLLAFYFWIRFRKGGKKGGGSQSSTTYYLLPTTYFYIASLLAFLLAMLSKEIAITLPPVLWLYDLYFVLVRRKIDHLKRIFWYIPFVASVALPYLIARKLFYGSFITSGYSRDFVLNLYTQAKIVVGYLRLLLFPADLTIDHPVRLAGSFWERDVAISGGLLLAILWIAYYLWKRQDDWKIVSFFVVWFFVTLLPIILIPLNAMLQENRAYLAGVGFAVSTGIVIGRLSKGFVSVSMDKPRRDRPEGLSLRGLPLPLLIYLGLLIPLIFAYSTATIHRNKVWKDDVTLWSDAVKKAPLSTRSYDNLGLAYDRIGNMEKAEEMYQKTLRLDPNYLFVYYNLGVLYQKQREWKKAENYYQQAIRLDPVYFNAYYNLGLVYQETGQYQKAIEANQKAISIDPRHPQAYNNLGVAYWLKGEKEEAIRSFLKAVEKSPDHFKAYYNLGNVYQEIGDYRKAIDAYQTVLKIDPAYEEAKERLREVKEGEGRR